MTFPSLSLRQLFPFVKSTPEAPKLYYLATPYSHKQAYIRESRTAKVNQLLAELMKDGVFIYSPISHTHAAAVMGDLPYGWEYWSTYDRLMISRCDGLIVHMDEGWEISKGVTDEIKLATEFQKPIWYLRDYAHEHSV